MSMWLKDGQSRERGLKAASCMCCVLLVVALVLIDLDSPVPGYELSIYDSLPAAAWICLIASLAGATGIVVHQAFAGQKSKYWLLGLSILVCCTSTILLLPVFRGYYLYGAADTQNHTRWTGDILSDGHVWGKINYPIAHILMAQLAQVSGAPLEAVVKCVPMFFTVLFMLFGYLLASSVMPKKGQALLVAATTPLFFGYYHVALYPQVVSMMMLPAIFYLYFKGSVGSSLPFRVAFVILLLWFPYSHPAPAAVLIVCLLTAEAAKAVLRLGWGATRLRANQAMDRITLEPTLICAVSFLTWISSFYVFHATVKKLLGWLEGEIRSVPRVEEVEELLETQGLGLQQRLELGLNLYGDNVIYLSLSAIALLIIAWYVIRRREEIKRLFTLSMPFLVSGPVWVLIFAGTLWVTVGRLLGANIMMWATPVFAAFALYEMFRRWKRIGVIVVTFILLCAAVVGILGVYHSPRVLQPSWQVTRQDVRGSSWFQAHATLRTYRWFANLGATTLMPGVFSIPEHFGYPQEQTLGGSVGLDFYMLLTQTFRLSSTQPILTSARFSPWAQSELSERDFQRLKEDPTVNKLYSNGEFEVLEVMRERRGS